DSGRDIGSGRVFLSIFTVVLLTLSVKTTVVHPASGLAPCTSRKFSHLYEECGPAKVELCFDAVGRGTQPLSLTPEPQPQFTSFVIGPIPYIGGKNKIAKAIIKFFPKHQTYVEPFAGGAQVFFHKEPSKVEVLNDLYGEVVNFFRVCQQHHDEFL